MMNTMYYRIKMMGLTVMAMLMAVVVTSCSQDEGLYAGTMDPEILQFDISDANASASGSTRAATDAQQMITTFQQGDVAGLYIVKNGEIKYENVKVTLNELNVWEAEHPIAATSELSGSTYYLYYPYSANVTFDANAEKPLQAYVDGITPADDQSTKMDYETADVMVGSTSTVSDRNIVSVKLEHQKSLVYMELPNTSYSFDNQNMDPYALAKAEDAVFTLGEVEVKPFLDTSTQGYRFIVNPGEENTLKVNFTYNGTKRYYAVKNLSKMTAGQYAKHVIDGGVQLTHFGTLQIGDYYCADGKLVSKDAATKPTNIVGVVYKIGTTETIQEANAYWSHAVVISVNEVQGKWGTSKAPSDAIDRNKTAAITAWNSWFTSFGLSQQNATAAASLDESVMAEEGYEVTQKWLEVPDNLTLEGESLDYTSLLKSNYEAWNKSHKLPANCNTGWYIPSLRDWLNIESEQNVINEQVEIVGGDALQGFDYTKNYYWSCNLRSAGLNWNFVLNASSLANRYKPIRVDYNEYYRFLLAF